jgi:acylphosphatase
MIARKIIVSGRVQGVFYRRFVKINADRLKIKGYVKNLSNGNVEIVFEGHEEKINNLINECRKGPAGAYVEDIEISKIDINGLENFEIRY